MKVDALKERLLTINPEAEITALQKVFTAETASEFHLDDYDYIIDAIDSLKDKATLILKACQTQATLFSSMGAALKIDPARIRTGEFWTVEGDPLARVLRRKFKTMKQLPQRKFTCVYSDELLTNKGKEIPEEEEADPLFHKVQTNGSLAHITAIFGFTLAGLVVKSLTTP